MQAACRSAEQRAAPEGAARSVPPSASSVEERAALADAASNAEQKIISYLVIIPYLIPTLSLPKEFLLCLLKGSCSRLTASGIHLSESETSEPSRLVFGVARG